MTVRRVVAATLAALLVGVVAVLGLAAAATAWYAPGAAVLLALAAVFVAQPLYVLTRRDTRR